MAIRLIRFDRTAREEAGAPSSRRLAWSRSNSNFFCHWRAREHDGAVVSGCGDSGDGGGWWCRRSKEEEGGNGSGAGIQPQVYRVACPLQWALRSLPDKRGVSDERTVAYTIFSESFAHVLALSLIHI